LRLVQTHTEFALDGLAPPVTITPIAVPAPAASATAMLTRAGMIFNWVPDRILYITDAGRNAIVALTLTSDEKVFRIRDNRTFTPPELNVPVDLAPVVSEIANPGFSSNTTLAGNSDIYVLNRGNGTIVRMRQDGTVVAVRKVALDGGEQFGPGRLNSRVARCATHLGNRQRSDRRLPGRPRRPDRASRLRIGSRRSRRLRQIRIERAAQRECKAGGAWG
jgi:hypothetical protein